MTKQEKIAIFDPGQPGLSDQSIFGLPFTAAESDIMLVPVPWEVTVSYGAGASQGPQAILDASFQVDLYHQEFPELWKLGIALDAGAEITQWEKENKTHKALAQKVIEALESGENTAKNPELEASIAKINAASATVNQQVKNRVLHWMEQGKFVALLGGDHSTPLGYYQALATKHHNFGILHLDAHFDLRNAYEGFTYSHASIMYNALALPQLTKIVQVGIRDFCEQEVQTVFEQKDRITVFTDADLKDQAFQGMAWHQQCDNIIAALPDKVCISFDIDGLFPWYCPNTGTPVPGGFSFEQATWLLSRLAASGKKIIGFDLVEVAPGTNDDWDGNVGARLLFHLCGVLAKSNGLQTGTSVRFNTKK